MYRALTALGILTFTSLLAVPSLAAQLYKDGDSGARELLPPAEEIALARSAAPAQISGDASIYVLGARGYELAVEGTSGAACYVSRAWRASLEPHCFDREGAVTVMRIGMRRVELLHAGRSVEEANRELAAGLLDGELRLPGRPALSWMMSSAQRLVNNDGEEVGAWRPHVMVYSPYMSAAELSLEGAPPQPLHALLANDGTALSNLVVVVPEFVDPEPVEPRADVVP